MQSYTKIALISSAKFRLLTVLTLKQLLISTHWASLSLQLSICVFACILLLPLSEQRGQLIHDQAPWEAGMHSGGDYLHNVSE